MFQVNLPTQGAHRDELDVLLLRILQVYEGNQQPCAACCSVGFCVAGGSTQNGSLLDERGDPLNGTMFLLAHWLIDDIRCWWESVSSLHWWPCLCPSHVISHFLSHYLHLLSSHPIPSALLFHSPPLILLFFFRPSPLSLSVSFFHPLARSMTVFDRLRRGATVMESLLG